MIDAEHQGSDTLSLLSLSSLRPRPWGLLGLLSLAVAAYATVCGPPRLTIEPVEVRRVGDHLVIITEVENWGRDPGQLHRHATLRSGGAEPVDLEIEDGAESTKTAKNEISEVAFTVAADAMPGAQGFDCEWMVIEASDSRGSSVESSRFWVDLKASPPALRPEASEASWVANVALADWKAAWLAWLATIVFFGIAAIPWVARKVERLKVDAEQPEADPFEDRPIRSSKEDGLGRSEFAKSIAECITKSRAGTSFSIAVTAPWGAGKSSLLNLVVEKLTEDTENDIRVLHFSPWSYDSTDKLVHAFIEMLRAELAELNDRLRISSALSDLETALLAMPATGVWAVVKSWWYASESSPLEVAREKIHQALREESSKRRFVVILDDLDRLDAESLRLALKLTRLIADFPGIIYLLGYDRAQVEKLLGETGHQYLEKFVQCSFELPAPRADALWSMLVTRLADVLLRLECGLDKQSEEILYEHWNRSLSKVMCNVRDINVVVKSVEITLPRVLGEVCLADFVAIEVLRIRRPTVYWSLRASKDRVFSTDGRSNESKGWLDEVAGDDEATKMLVRSLFPQLEPGPAGFSDFFESSDSYAQMRVRTREHFDRHFSWVLDDNDIRRQDIDQINGATTSGELKSIEQLMGFDRFWRAVHRPDLSFRKTSELWLDDTIQPAERKSAEMPADEWVKFLAEDRDVEPMGRLSLLQEFFSNVAHVNGRGYVEMCGPRTAVQLALCRWSSDRGEETASLLLEHAFASDTLWKDKRVVPLLYRLRSRKPQPRYPNPPDLAASDLITLLKWSEDRDMPNPYGVLEHIFPREYLEARLSQLDSSPDLDQLRQVIASKWPRQVRRATRGEPVEVAEDEEDAEDEGDESDPL